MDKRPWYIPASLSVFAWIAGLLITATLAVMGREVFGLTNGLSLSVFGVILTPLAVIASRRLKTVFLSEIATALTLGGSFAVIFGIRIKYDADASAIAACLLAGIIYPLINAISLRFVLSATALIMTGLALEGHFPYYAFDIIGLACVPLGALLVLFPPPKIDTRPLSVALLLATPVLSGVSFGTRAITQGGGALTLMGLIVLLGVLTFMRHHMRLSVLIALSLTAMVAAWALPAGGTAALLILALGWAMGDRALAMIGAIVSTYFLVRYYGEVNLSLLHKSWVLGAVGVALLITWGLAARKKGPS